MPLSAAPGFVLYDEFAFPQALKVILNTKGNGLPREVHRLLALNCILPSQDIQQSAHDLRRQLCQWLNFEYWIEHYQTIAGQDEEVDLVLLFMVQAYVVDVAFGSRKFCRLYRLDPVPFNKRVITRLREGVCLRPPHETLQAKKAAAGTWTRWCEDEEMLQVQAPVHASQEAAAASEDGSGDGSTRHGDEAAPTAIDKSESQEMSDSEDTEAQQMGIAPSTSAANPYATMAGSGAPVTASPAKCPQSVSLDSMALGARFGTVPQESFEEQCEGSKASKWERGCTCPCM
eukprot:s3643_g3.t2